MFTGIIEEVGVVAGLAKKPYSARLRVRAAKVVQAGKVGESIAVNGVCLTVTSLRHGFFTADVMPETLRLSNLGLLRAGDKVNLERALRAGDRMGGHQVTGHVDAVGRIRERRAEGNAMVYRIQVPGDLMRFFVPKGSVAVDGASLTVSALGGDWFEVSLIPHTRSVTTLGSRNRGDLVNVEADQAGKYLINLALSLPRQPAAAKKALTAEFLADAGF